MDSEFRERVRIVQCLCGPARHCILALPYMPGLTAAQDTPTSDITLTPANAAGYVRDMVRQFLANRTINPWYGICDAPAATWCYEDAITRFDSMEDAMRAAKTEEAKQLLTGAMIAATKKGRPRG